VDFPWQEGSHLEQLSAFSPQCKSVTFIEDPELLVERSVLKISFFFLSLKAEVCLKFSILVRNIIHDWQKLQRKMEKWRSK
jgi:hypothetical protein